MPIEEEDPNSSILVSKTKEQKEQERQEKLRQEVCCDHYIGLLGMTVVSLQLSRIQNGILRRKRG